MLPPDPPDFPDLDAIQPEGKPSSNSFASVKKEKQDWVNREEDKKDREHTREQQGKTFIHYVILGNIVLAGICIGGALFVRTLHLLLPKCKLWLDSEQIETLDTLGKFAITGALGSLLTRYLNKNTDGTEKAPE